jgi:hypothetical protein
MPIALSDVFRASKANGSPSNSSKSSTQSNDEVEKGCTNLVTRNDIFRRSNMCQFDYEVQDVGE